MKITLSLGQMNIKLGLPEVNLECALDWIDQAADSGSSVVLFPELWTSGYDLTNRGLYGPKNKALIPTLQSVASRRKIWIGGSMIEERDGNFYNSFHLLAPDPHQSIRYDKIHLFRLMDEDQYFSPGESPIIADLPWGRTALATCYDLRFPELFRNYAIDGAVIVLLVSEWPIQRMDHWRTLLRARAIENQMFFAAVNSVGKIGQATYAGSSAIIDPWGEVIVEGSTSDEALLSATIDLEQVDRVRSKIPVFNDRRPDLYH